MSGTLTARTTRPETASRGLPATPLAPTAQDALGRILARAIAVCVSMWDRLDTREGGGPSQHCTPRVGVSVRNHRVLPYPMGAAGAHPASGFVPLE